jgi:hypothetical protein
MSESQSVTITRGKYRGQQATVIEQTGTEAAVRLASGNLATVSLKSIKAPEARTYTEAQIREALGELDYDPAVSDNLMRALNGEDADQSEQDSAEARQDATEPAHAG